MFRPTRAIRSPWRGPTRVLLSSAVWATVGATVWLGLPSASRACSCLPPKPPVVAAREAHAVFEGRPGRPIPRGGDVQYTFKVTRVFRGRVPSRVEVLTPAHSAMCGRRFEPDATYLVYATVQGNDDRLRDNMCSRTRPSADASQDYSALGVSRQPGVDVETPSEPSPEDMAPTTEPPRIETAPNLGSEPGPPSQPPATSKRGCRMGEMPHGARELWLGTLTLLGIANRRRRILR